MKKRSLVAAIAMLIVSAIVLTSSTYAWFASNGKADVNEISASVANNDGSLQIKANTHAAQGADWTTALGTSNYQAFPSTLQPVSMSMDTGSPSFFMAAYDGLAFKASSETVAANTQYYNYSFLVKYINNSTTKDATVTVKPTWSDTSGFTYALIKLAVTGGNTTYYIMDAAGGYTPLKSITATQIADDKDDANKKVDVVDATDDGYNANDMGVLTGATSTASLATTINFTAGKSTTSNDTVTVTETNAEVTVWIWAEGQDPQCSGPSAAGTATLEFELTAAPVNN